MTRLDEHSFSPADFEASFAGEPVPVPAHADLARGRRSRRRRQALCTATVAGVTALAVVLLGGGLPDRSVEVGPAGPGPLTAAPTASATSTPARPSAPPTPTADTVPPLRSRTTGGYLDAKGEDDFRATTRNTYELVQRALDPGQAHLRPYEPMAFSGGGVGASLQVGQKLGWTVEGEQGEGMLLVSVSRPLPGERARVAGPEGMGQCSGSFADLPDPCRERTVGGRQVLYASLGGGGFVVDYVQPDGEVASLLKDPLFGNNTSVALESMEVSVQQAARLLADPRLDVVG